MFWLTIRNFMPEPVRTSPRVFRQVWSKLYELEEQRKYSKEELTPATIIREDWKQEKILYIIDN